MKLQAKEIRVNEETKTVVVCAHCMPGSSCFDVRQDLRSFKISHSICATHFAEMIAEANALKTVTI